MQKTSSDDLEKKNVFETLHRYKYELQCCITVLSDFADHSDFDLFCGKKVKSRTLMTH